MCVHTFPSLGAGVRSSGRGLRWFMLAAAAGRIPQIGPQQVTWNAGDARDRRHPLRWYHPPLTDGPLLDAQLTSDQRPDPATSRRAKQVHSGKRGRHQGRLSAAKSTVQPEIHDAVRDLLSQTELAVCHITDMAIGEIIRAARVRAGFTQRYVAKALDVGPSAVNQWESGLTKPSITKRAQLAVLLKLSITDLIPGAPVDEVTEAISQLVREVPLSKQAALVIAVEQLVKLMNDAAPASPMPRPAKPKREK